MREYRLHFSVEASKNRNERNDDDGDQENRRVTRNLSTSSFFACNLRLPTSNTLRSLVRYTRSRQGRKKIVEVCCSHEHTNFVNSSRHIQQYTFSISDFDTWKVWQVREAYQFFHLTRACCINIHNKVKSVIITFNQAKLNGHNFDVIWIGH